MNQGPGGYYWHQGVQRPNNWFHRVQAITNSPQPVQLVLELSYRDHPIPSYLLLPALVWLLVCRYQWWHIRVSLFTVPRQGFIHLCSPAAVAASAFQYHITLVSPGCLRGGIGTLRALFAVWWRFHNKRCGLRIRRVRQNWTADVHPWDPVYQSNAVYALWCLDWHQGPMHISM